MPQMSPMWWPMLFLFFLFSFMYFNVMLYYLMINKKFFINNSFMNFDMNWLW
uniref:ATP synthase F0 subunit 8 n=1 Tax=Philagra albinotata TaxID=868271 RepID=UPI002551E5CF|nr:ATP synthase F0 subunit 8 [Philagra albinotata]WGL39473.1 ATP synthase F0 subunit 8 [Philagra albinotata]